MGPRGGSPARKASSKSNSLQQTLIRYTLSSDEYDTLYRHAIKRLPARLRTPLPHPSEYIVHAKSSDYNAAAVRASLRLFLAAQTGLKLWDVISARLLRRGRPQRSLPKVNLLRSSNFRLSSSISFILLLHRLLHRFFTLLRANLLTKGAAPFRRRNPRIAKALTARLAPSIGAGLAGFALGVCPGDQLRITIAIYAATRAAEFGYNALEEIGWFKRKPWWFGSWMLTPPVFGQLLHTFLFDRDCFPKSYGDFILNHTPNYIQRRPADYPADLAWPNNNDIVEGLATLSRLRYPPFVSPILFPDAKESLAPSLAAISPITSSAHPSIRSTSCAVLHPAEPSCLRSYLTFYLEAFPSFAKFFAIVFSLFAVPRYKSFVKHPAEELNRLSKTILRTTMFVSGAVGTSWGSICLFQALFPRTFLPTKRWFLGGFLGGLWAFLEREWGRPQFLYSLRVSMDSTWKLGIKKGWWKAGKYGDVWVFTLSLMALNAIFEEHPDALTSGLWKRGLEFVRGEARAVQASDDRGKGGSSNS